MVSVLKTVKWNLDDYHRMIDGGILTNRQVELLWGEIVEMPISAVGRETIFVQNLQDELRYAKKSRSRYPMPQNPNLILPLFRTWERNISSIIPTQKISFG